MINLRRLASGAGFGFLVLVAPSVTQAQEWIPPRQIPSPWELIALDRTGEPDWPWGAEDVGGDGVGQFSTEEQGLDVRTAYAGVGDTRFWVRVYLSTTAAPPTTTSIYVFLDTDRSASTGGSAQAPTIDAALTSDPSGGGYERVIRLRGSEGPSAWQWNDASRAYVDLALTPARAKGTAGEALDPLRWGTARHGYLQGAIDLDAINVNSTCSVRVLVRSVTTVAELAPGDLDVGVASTCVPADQNADHVPDLLVPPQCTRDQDCPLNGICVRSRCVLPGSCVTSQDCAAEDECTSDGLCVARGGDSCTNREACGDLVCQGARCVACTSDSACGQNARCGPDGRCVEASGGGTGTPSGSTGDGGPGGLTLNEGDRVRGGALTCGISSTRNRDHLAWAGLAWVAVAALIRRSSSRRAGR